MVDLVQSLLSNLERGAVRSQREIHKLGWFFDDLLMSLFSAVNVWKKGTFITLDKEEFAFWRFPDAEP